MYTVRDRRASSAMNDEFKEYQHQKDAELKDAEKCGPLLASALFLMVVCCAVLVAVALYVVISYGG